MLHQLLSSIYILSHIQQVAENTELLIKYRDNIVSALGQMGKMTGEMAEMPPLPAKPNLELANKFLPPPGGALPGSSPPAPSFPFGSAPPMPPGMGIRPSIPPPGMIFPHNGGMIPPPSMMPFHPGMMLPPGMMMPSFPMAPPALPPNGSAPQPLPKSDPGSSGSYRPAFTSTTTTLPHFPSALKQ